ncbi:MAG: hypothetical protein UX91_C0003G0091, partial [Candidatus Amesbacteria bacterium GW2011_GWB1_47_19]
MPDNNLPYLSNLLSIQQAAKLLKVSTKTLRRWEAQGILTAHRTPGNQRRYQLGKLLTFSKKKPAGRIYVSTSPVDSSSSTPLPESPFFHSFNTPGLPKLGLYLSALGLAGIISFTTLHRVKNLVLGTSSTHSPVAELTLPDQTGIPSSAVLATQDDTADYTYQVNVPGVFSRELEVKGNLTAPNIIYSLVAGRGITISSGQTPTISAIGGVTGFQGQTGDISLTAGSGIAIDGLSIRNTDPGSSQNIWKTFKVSGQSDLVAGSNTDTLTFVAGSNIGLTTNTTDKKLTISVSTLGPTSGGTGITSYTIGDMLYASVANTLGKLPIGGSGQILTVSGGIPGWATASASTQYWQQNSGTLSPSTITDDLLVGGISTASATFRVLSGTGSISTSGNLEVDGSLTLGSDTISDITGNGLATSGTSLTINLPSVADSLSVTTSSASGLEVLSQGLTLLQGCGNNEILKWNESSDIWVCSTDTSGGVENFWQRNAGTLSPLNITDDVLVGGISTSSAKLRLAVTGDTELFSQADLRLFDSDNTNYTGFQAPSNVTGTGVYTLPAVYPVSSAFLKSDASGVLSLDIGTYDNYQYWTISDGSLTTNITTTGTASFTGGSGIATTNTTGTLDIDVDLLTASDSAGVASSRSGLEFGDTGDDKLTMLQGCGNGQVLKWDEPNGQWSCANDAGATSAIINVETSDNPIGAQVDTLDFGPDF